MTGIIILQERREQKERKQHSVSMTESICGEVEILKTGKIWDLSGRLRKTVHGKTSGCALWEEVSLALQMIRKVTEPFMHLRFTV